MIGVYIFFTIMFMVFLIGIFFGNFLVRFFSGEFLAILLELFGNFISTSNFINDIEIVTRTQYAFMITGIVLVLFFCAVLVYEIINNKGKEQKPKDMYDIY